MDTIGSNIKTLREGFGLTQEQVAQYLGINRVEVSYFEGGSRKAPLAVLIRLSDLFGVNLDVLIEQDVNIADINTAIAFRANDLQKEDLGKIEAFQKFIRNYLKMERLLNDKSRVNH
jgi:transcriptional regulator with XRE-family HTH domain